MAKRLLSTLLCLALLLSCISGITLFTMAEDPSAPIGYFDFGGNRGAVQKSGGVVRPIMANNNENTSDLRGGSPIGTTGLYGYKITREGYGVYFGGALLNAVPDGTGVTYAVNYYIDSATPLTGDVLLVTDGVNGEKNFADLAVGEQGTVYYSLSAAAVDAIQANEAEGDTRLRMKALGEGAGKLYITGVTILSSFYCTAETANADTVAALHEHMLADEVNIELRNAKAGSPFETGYTGDTVCVSCETVLVAGEEIPAKSDLPAPYAWMETDGGVLTTNRTMSATGTFGSTEVVPIPNTDMYGIPLKGDWSGFWIDLTFAADVPADQSVTVVVEYYIDKDFAPTDSYQGFRYQAYEGWQGGTSDGNAWNNMLTDSQQLKSRESGLFYYTFTAEDRAAIGSGNALFTIAGCGWGANATYIQSLCLLNTEYVHGATDTAYAYMDFTARPLCEYYPDIMVSASKDVRLMVQDRWNFALSGDILATDSTQNKPVYIQVKMKDTYPHDSMDLDQFERYGGAEVDRWAYNNVAWTEREEYRTIPLTDGVGGILLPEASFTNSNNDGSVRIGMDFAPYLERIAFYDLNTFCKKATATAEDVAMIHAAMLEKNVNIVREGRVESTEQEEGYTGDAVCAVCGDVLAQGVTIPVIDPNRPLASMNTAGGILALDGCTLSVQGSGNCDVVAIGDTGEYGIKLPSDWSGFNMDGLSLLGANGQVAMLIEYYTEKKMDNNWRMFRYKINDRNHVDVMGATHSLVSGRSALVYHVFTAEELAAIGDNAFTFRIMACDVGANVTYIQSVKLVSANVLDLEMDKGYGYIDFTPQEITPVYPDVLQAPAYLMGYVDMESGSDRDWQYRYITVSGDLLAKNNASRPVYIKLYAAEGHENDTVTIGAVECVAGAFGTEATVQMTDGVGGVFLPSATFTNGLNGVASLRMWWEEAEKVTRMEILNADAYCAREDADAALVEMFHAGFAAERMNVNIVGKLEPTEEAEGYTGDVYCATCNEKLAEGTSVPKLEASDLPTPYAYFDTANGVLKSKGVTLGNYGVEPVPLPIGGSGEYGIKLTGDWKGFNMKGMQLPTDKNLTVAIEYYVNADLAGSQQLFRYQAYDNMPGDILSDGNDSHWNDIYSDQDNIVSRRSGLLFYSLTPEAVEALNGGDVFEIVGCGPGTNIVYIQSVRVIDTAYMLANDTFGYDYIRFEEAPLCAYYPNIVGTPGVGITVSSTVEGIDPDTEEEQRYAYFKVMRSLVEEGQLFRPVVIRFTFKEDSAIERFDWQYQGARRTTPPDGGEWMHQSSVVEDGVVEVILTAACFANELNGLGSFRVSNRVSNPVLDSLLMVEVVALADTSSLQALVDGAEETVIGKAKASADAYRALVAEKAALLEDMWVTEEAIASAVAELQAAAEQLVDCVHEGETETVHVRAVENHVVPGYTGDIRCVECNAVIKEGETIPAHKTEFRNQAPATCDAPGNMGDCWCLDCDKLVTAGEKIVQLPHTWDDGVVTKPATSDTKGELTITCTVCGTKKITRLDFTAAIGDVDESGTVDSTDARLVLQFAVKKIQPSALKLKVADVDGNGKVDSTDARLILQYAVRKIDKLPAA